MAEQTSPAQTPAPKTDKTAHVAPTTQREVLMQQEAEHPSLKVAAHLPTDIDVPFKVIDPQTGETVEPKKVLTPDQQKIEDTKKAEKQKADAARLEQKKKVDAEKAELYKKVGEALAKHGGNESNVPSSDPYWSDIAKLRSLS